MLRRLRIKDFALVESLDLDFQTSMISITGETGSGKSLIFDALSSILGGKCNTLNIRSGAKKYQIEAIFDISKFQDVKAWLIEKNIPLEAEELVLRKELNIEGKSRVQINSALTPSQYLKELGGMLCEIHRQSEQHSFLDREKQLELLDLYAELEKQKKEFCNVFYSYRKLKSELQELELAARDTQRRFELFRFQLEEIERAELSEKEETLLLQEEKLLVHSEKIAENLGLAEELLSESERGILVSLAKTQSCLEKISHLRPEFANLAGDLREVYHELKEIHSSIIDELDGLDYSYERLVEVQTRLDEISRIKKKFGRSISEILEYKEKISKELDLLESGDSSLASLRQKLDQQKVVLTDLAIQLSLKRRKAIVELESEIQKELEELGMKDSRLQIVMRWEPSPEGDISENGKKYFVQDTGLDTVDFYFSANPGEKLRPLRKIASGGEISRIVLAFKKILGDKVPGKILLFDEIDTGISGEVALQVAVKLRSISQTHQIFLITHQQSIAAASLEQIVVQKSVVQGRTVSVAKKLSNEQRATELAKMISGNEITKGALEHAKELLKKVAI